MKKGVRDPALDTLLDLHGQIRRYDYKDAAALLEDFWKTVDEVLRERGSFS